MPHDHYSAYFEEGFRITSTDEGGLEIRTTDFHARPHVIDGTCHPRTHRAGMQRADPEVLRRA